jgi:4-amino-4-deoxy-L-arabinose transferase-like glycosyltransferase
MSKKRSIAQNAKEWLPLIFVLVAALGLRLVFFTGMVRGDSLNYAHTAYYLNLGIFDLGAWEGMSRIGLYLPVAVLYKLFGPSELVTLLFPLLSSLASVVFVYLIARIFGGERAGLIAALIWAILPMDVHLSTSLLPDGPMAALCTASVYFWFKAGASKRSFYYFVSLGLLVWAILVKPLAIVVALFFVVTLILQSWQQVKTWWFSNRIFQAAKGKYFWPAAAVLTLVVILFYLQIQKSPFLVTLARTNNDLGSFFFTGAAQLDFGDIDFSRSDLMIFVAPLFLASFLMLLRLRRVNVKPVLVWAAVLFVYYEWGSVSLKPLKYDPLQAFSEARYFLFLLAPFVILTGIYLARGLSDRLAPWSIPVLALITLVVGIVAKDSLYAGGWLGWTSTSSFLLVVGALASPLLLAEKQRPVGGHCSASARLWRTEMFRNGFVVLLLLVLSLSLLQPFLPYHALMYRDRLDQLKAFRLSMPFWDDHEDYPICSSDPLSLNYASNFQLGFDWQGLSISGKPPRIVDPATGEESCYVVTTSGQEVVPENWWLVEDFVSGQETVYAYRVLGQVDANRELSISRTSINLDRTKPNLERFFGASVNASSWADIFPAWIELHNQEAAKYPLEYLDHLVIAYLEKTHLSLGENLLVNSDFSQSMVGWSYPDPERISFGAGGNATLRIGDKTVGLSQDVMLQPGQIYLFTMNAATDLEIELDFLVLDQGGIPDSNSRPITADNPTDFSAVFVTPNWTEPKLVNVELFAALGSGRVRLQDPALYAIPIVTE